MRKILHLFLFLFLFWFCPHLAEAQLSTVGKEFWVGFMDNNRILPDAPDQAVIVISANEDATGVIEYRGRSIPFNLSQGQQFSHIIPSTDLDMLHRNTGQIENKGIYISSNGKIAVYAFNERYRSADGTVVLPLGALGKDYLITSHYEFLTAQVQYNGNINDESELLVVATEDNTEIEITTSVDAFGGTIAGIPFTINLDRGQSYQLKAKADLTGSRVRVIGEDAANCKKIAVFGGNKWTSVGDCGAANDNLFQQAYPISSWGTSFVHVAFAGRTSGELVKVLASEDNTQVTIGGQNSGTIDAGEYLTLEFGVNESAKINTSKPASVTVFAKSQECNQTNDPDYQNGDPFMISYSPSEQLLKEIRFNALSLPSIVSHYLNLVVKAGTEDLTILDGQNQGAKFSPVPGDPNFSYARINITQGVHRLENSEGFTGYVYGFGFLESYGFAVGAALDNLNFETDVEYDFEVDGENVACLGQEGTWNINSENPIFTYFLWDFGDGSEMAEGEEVTHIFTEPGEYEVTVLASISPNSCDQQEEITFVVDVQAIEEDIELIGETSVCPEVEQLVYKLSESGIIPKVEFEVEGGVIVENYGDSVLVNWGVANDFAKLSAIPFTENGCPLDTISLNVKINKQLVAEIASGPEEICFDPTVLHTYEAPNLNDGRGYDWDVIGGTIVSGHGEGIIEVSWDQPGVTGSVSYTVYSLVDQSCEGLSPTLEVNVADTFEAKITAITPVLCFGGNDGEIELEITGGIAPYQYAWSHDPDLQSNKASLLEAGSYEVTITDQLGCSLVLSDLVVSEPDVLEIQSLIANETSCYGKSDGKLSLSIVGGTAPYSIDFNGPQSFTGTLALSDLEQGTYEWELIDANGCVLPISFEIISPPAMEVEVRLEKPACPGGSNGELLAFPEGGNNPYIYTWENPLGVGNQLIGVPKGNYNISVLDKLGCVSLGVGVVKEAAPALRMPTGFNPQEGIYQGVSNCEVSFELWIYNRWGQLIYSGAEGWDGMTNDQESPSGSYSYLVQYSFPLDGEIQTIEKRGAFTLIR
ncbi:PKD domain-containing protein [Algoriphagus pacificus]|uniref:PKD domain-containing protein n=1 Tax=Algoriphagus pacificus TaxID=2811234 RepID=A0ABS3CH20_9BACT|nr:PKD domain-containing protein [Algoriphagus pacificus]MBN7816398.1 PKD domain-containing protein [Algoriphagus pacificus]